MRRLVALALCATSAAAAVAHSLDNFVRPGVHHASFFDVDASVSAQTSAEGLDVIWANHLDETAMDVRETPDGLRLDYDVTRSLRLTGLRASLSSNSIRADGSTAGAGSRSSASAGSGSRSRASSESRSRETSEHAAAPPYPSPASLCRSI